MMRTFKKIIVTLFIFFILFITGIGVFAWLRHDQLASALIKKVNSSVNTRITYKSINVSVFESFPNITVRFNDLLVAPSKFYNRKQLQKEDNDTLLYVSSLSLAVDIPSMVTGSVAVRSITARDGELNLLTDKNGDINYEVFPEKSEGESSTSVSLNSITLKNIRTVYSDRQNNLRIAGLITESSISGDIFNTGIFLSMSLSSKIASANIYGTAFSDIPLKTDLRVRKSESSFSIAEGILDLAGLNFRIDGTWNYRDKAIDVVIKGNKIDISELISLLPEKPRSAIEAINPGGIMSVNGICAGPYGNSGKPHFEVRFDLTHGHLSNMASGLNVNDLSFNGGVTNGNSNSSETFAFSIDTLTTNFGSAYFAGSFALKNLEHPNISLALDGDLTFEDLRKILKSDFLSHQTGSIKGTVFLNGTIPDSSGFSLADLPALNPDASLVFKDFGATISSKNLSFSGVSGSVHIGNDLSTDSLSLTILDQHFLFGAVMKNFTPWLVGKPEIMDISGEVHVDMFKPELFTGSSDNKHNDKEKEPNIFQDDISMNIRLKADSIINKGFRAGNFTSNFIYRPHVISFSNIRANGLDGYLSGDLIIGKQKDNSYISRGNLEVTGINIFKAFKAFNNFGQGFIKSENLSGNVTGNVTILTPLDNSFNIITKTLVAEAHLSISDGHLTKFEPAKCLSSYLDLDELEDISFSKMENDIYIRNRTVSIPKMLINSSAGNFTVYGTHTFDGDYSYHVRVLLSEVLSRKARESHRNDSAFGKVNVDGTGKATIPLKIVCQDDNVTVGYDFGQAQDNVKENIAEEKQTLKGILNEEYGWYKGDSVIKPAEDSKPKFSITWEEGKVQTSDTAATSEKEKSDVLKKLFKRPK